MAGRCASSSRSRWRRWACACDCANAPFDRIVHRFDLNDRVIVVDRKTQDIVWQYGVKGTKGHAPGYLNYPDGLDLDVFRDWRSVPR